MPARAPAQPPATADRILDAALDAFAEHGYRGTSVRTIAAAAGANVAAINYHWGSKERLWTAVCERCSQRVMQTIQGAVRFPLVPEQVLDDVMGALFDWFVDDPRPVRILVWAWMQADSMDFESTATTFDPLVELLFRYIESVKAGGRITDIDADVVTGLLQGALITPFIAQVAARRQLGTDFSDPDYAARVKAQLLRAARLLFGEPV